MTDEAAATAQVISVQAVSAKIPDFWPEDTKVWFQQVDAQFRIAKITTEQTKFDHVIQKLDRDTVKRVRDLVSSPPERDPYTQLKDRLLGCFKRSPYEELLDFHNVTTLGDRRPSELMDELLSAIPSISPATEGASLWIAFGFLHRLPDHLRSLITALDLKPDMRLLAEQADRLWMASGGAAQATRRTAPFVNALPLNDLAEALPRTEEEAVISAVRQFRRNNFRPAPKSSQDQRERPLSHSMHACDPHTRHGKNSWYCDGKCAQPGCAERCTRPTARRPGNGMAGGRKN